jgi:hypothetical protein
MNFLIIITIITITLLSLIAFTGYSYKEGARNIHEGVTMDMQVFQDMLKKERNSAKALKDIHYFNNMTALQYGRERIPK